MPYFILSKVSKTDSVADQIPTKIKIRLERKTSRDISSKKRIEKSDSSFSEFPQHVECF